jgi:hypothetical protein
MARSSKLMITEAERRFPMRIKVAMSAGGLGKRLNQMHDWLDENCGADGWAMTPAGMRSVVNDAVAIYFLDTAHAAAFVARWCVGTRPETAEGSFRVRCRCAKRSQRHGRPHRTTRGRCKKAPPSAAGLPR